MPELPPPPPPPLSLAAAFADVLRRRRPEWATPRVAFGAGAAALLVALAVLGVSRRSVPPPPEVFLPRVETTTPAGEPGVPSASPHAGQVAVHAAGAFNRPGLYELPAGSRVAQLVDAAGGTAADALVDAINLAARLNDGERIYLPRVGEQVAAGDSNPTPGTAEVIDLNTATLEQLDSLPGIGPSTAQAILDYRRERGRFRSVDELLDVRGIGEAKLASIRKRLRT